MSRLALLLLALASAACRSGQGDVCRCATDCKSGLECYAPGEKVLEGNQCFEPGVVGKCVLAQSIDSDSGPVELTEPPTYLDLPSNRDLGSPGSDSITDSGTGGATTGTTGDTASGTGTTGTSTGTTGTSTGTTGETTGTTGTTGGPTTGTTGGSTGDSTGSSSG